MSTFLNQTIDFKRHNEMVETVWASFNDGKPVRVPLQIHGSITNYFFNPQLNTHGFTFEQFFKDPQVQINAQLEYTNWIKHNVIFDHEMGVPESWHLWVDFQNSFEASWVGAPMQYIEGQLPDTLPIFDANRDKLYEMPKVLPIERGVLADGMAFMDYMTDYCKSHEYMGRPIVPPQRFVGEFSDGVFTLACKLRGAENLIYDMLDECGYYEDLMEWLTENLINRMLTLRKMRMERWGQPIDFFYADDSIELLSYEMYKKYVLPYQKRIFDALAGGKKCGVHLCGNSMHLFEGLVRDLPINALDTGFPIDHGKLRKMVGPDITLYTGPTIMLLQNGSEDAVRAEVKRILETGITEGGKYVMIAANNMAPRTPVQNIRAMYEALQEYGRY